MEVINKGTILPQIWCGSLDQLASCCTDKHCIHICKTLIGEEIDQTLPQAVLWRETETHIHTHTHTHTHTHQALKTSERWELPRQLWTSSSSKTSRILARRGRRWGGSDETRRREIWFFEEIDFCSCCSLELPRSGFFVCFVFVFNPLNVIFQ
jgi:hypothetical protein